MMVGLFVLGCTGVVVFLHGANFFFHVISQNFALRSLSDSVLNSLPLPAGLHSFFLFVLVLLGSISVKLSGICWLVDEKKNRYEISKLFLGRNM